MERFESDFVSLQRKIFIVMAYPNNTNYRLSYIETLETLKNYKEALENLDLLLALDEKNIY